MSVKLQGSTDFTEPFWITHPDVLIYGKDGKNAKRFIPTAQMDLYQRLNAITRFCMYLFCILFLFSDSHIWLYIPLIGALAMVMVWAMRNSEDDDSSDSGYTVHGKYRDHTDANGPRGSGKTGKISKMIRHKKLPTYENPFMNHMMSDYDGDQASMEERLSLQPEKWTKVKADVDKEYYQGMYRNTSDIYEQESAKRSFYQMPSTTVPNDQDAFAKWCYRAPSVCKESGQGCVRYADPRNERRIAQSEYVI